MSFQLFSSNDCESLLRQLAKNIFHQQHTKQTPHSGELTHAFSPPTIITASEQEKQNLNFQLAKLYGIAPQIDVLFAEDWLTKIYQQNIGQRVVKKKLLTKESWLGLIYQDLVRAKEQKHNQHDYPFDLEPLKDSAVWEKSKFIEQALHQCMLYRFELLVANKQPLAKQTAKKAFQTQFQFLLPLYYRLKQDHWSIVDLLIDGLPSIIKQRPATLPANLIFWEPEHLPPFWLAVLEHINSVCKVELYLFNPSENYWFDNAFIRQQESLTDGLQPTVEQKESAENYFLHNSLDFFLHHHGQSVGSIFRQLATKNWIDDLGFLPATRTNKPSQLLCIQQSIQHLQPVDCSQIKEKELGKNVRFFAVDTPEKEIAALEQNIKHWLQQNPTASPADVAIICTDIKFYQPYLSSWHSLEPWDFLLGSQLINTLYQPGTVDRFLQFVQLIKSPLTLEQLFELLSIDEIKHCFAITDEQIAQYKKLFAKLNVHEGLNEQHLARWQQHPTNQGTWDNALNVLAKQLWRPERWLTDHEEWHCTQFNFLDPFLCCYQQLKDFINQQGSILESMDESFCIDDWQKFINSIIDCFWSKSADQKQETRLYWAQIMNRFAESSIEQVSWNLIMHLAQHTPERISTQQSGIQVFQWSNYPLTKKKATFVLGFDSNSFPQDQSVLPYQIFRQHKLGDPQRQKLLLLQFLKMILTTEQSVTISYLSQDMSDSQEQTLAYSAELLAQCFSSDPAVFWHKQQLPQAKIANKNTAQANNQQSAIRLTEQKPKHKQPIQRIHWNQFVRFWANPLQFYYRNIVQLEPVRKTPPKNQLSFPTHSWQKEKIFQQAYEAFIEHPADQKAMQKALQVNKHLLPTNKAGKMEWKSIEDECQKYFAILTEKFAGKPIYKQSLEINLPVSLPPQCTQATKKVKLFGKIHFFYTTADTILSLNPEPQKDFFSWSNFVEAFLKQLIATIEQPAAVTNNLYYNSHRQTKGSAVQFFQTLFTQKPQDILTKMVSIFLATNDQPFPMPTVAAMDYLKAKHFPSSSRKIEPSLQKYIQSWLARITSEYSTTIGYQQRTANRFWDSWEKKYFMELSEQAGNKSIKRDVYQEVEELLSTFDWKSA